MSEQLSVKCVVEVPEQAIKDCFANGLDWIGYWAGIGSHNLEECKGEGTEYLSDLPWGTRQDGKNGPDYGYLTLEDRIHLHEGDGEVHRCQCGYPDMVITKESLHKAVSLMSKDYPRHFWDLVQGTGDAITGDVLIQLAVFGDVVYG